MAVNVEKKFLLVTTEQERWNLKGNQHDRIFDVKLNDLRFEKKSYWELQWLLAQMGRSFLTRMKYCNTQSCINL